MESSDEALLRRVERGDGREAEAEICRRFAPRIRLYGLRHLGDAARSDDLVQIVLLAVLSALRAGRIEDLGKFDRFVLGTCRNSVSRIRQSAMRLQLAPTGELPEIAVEGREPVDATALTRCLQQLSERAQHVLISSFYDERSADEIAAKLQTSSVHVRVLRHRAMASLRACLDASGEARP